MSQNNKIIPIFFAVDDGYIPFLAVTLQSMLKNASKLYNYEIRVLYTNISEENKQKILKYENKRVSIEFVDLNIYLEELQDKFYTRDYYTNTTYYRLFIPNLYPQYDKVLYLDCDIVILGDISKLYNTDIEDNLIGAIPCEAMQISSELTEYAEKVIGMKNVKDYINAGILVMNLNEMRKIDFQSKFIYLLETIKYKVAQDQDYINRMCKGRIKYIDSSWEVEPHPTDTPRKEKDLNIIHYLLIYKPWHFDNVLYQEYFWEYAKKTEYYEDILQILKTYRDIDRARDIEKYIALKDLAQFEANCVGDDRQAKEHQDVKKSQDRIKILKKIENLEKKGMFDVDVEDDPPTITLQKEDVDYLKEKRTSRIKSRIAYTVGEVFVNDLLKNNKLIIKEIKGMENMINLNSGAIITCNHFNPFDSLAIEKVFKLSKQNKVRRLYKVIREGNYTNFPGLYGFFFRNCDTLPLSSSKETMVEFMKAVNTILQRNDFILIYPEQSMWWNYRKPKPLKNGAYKFATRNKVPVLPIFITMEDSEIIGEDGFPVQEYIINIEKPIYPREDLSDRENIEFMKNKNYEIWKNIYEEFYKKPLEYTTIQNDEKENVNG
ncbi:MAG: 1-acyl-sn-glycerol-3-phosphate acyltransferase [Clostridia bacterium]|nr:1-acyl-sn-glycerol-3-phosphate acyltransferase [Clostridia bacterium]